VCVRACSSRPNWLLTAVCMLWHLLKHLLQCLKVGPAAMYPPATGRSVLAVRLTLSCRAMPCCACCAVLCCAAACPPGAGSPGGGQPCQACLPGFYSAGGRSPCLPCPEGKTTIAPASSICGEEQLLLCAKASCCGGRSVSHFCCQQVSPTVMTFSALPACRVAAVAAAAACQAVSPVMVCMAQ
jgi:hypothetical protein